MRRVHPKILLSRFKKDEINTSNLVSSSWLLDLLHKQLNQSITAASLSFAHVDVKLMMTGVTNEVITQLQTEL